MIGRIEVEKVGEFIYPHCGSHTDIDFQRVDISLVDARMSEDFLAPDYRFPETRRFRHFWGVLHVRTVETDDRLYVYFPQLFELDDVDRYNPGMTLKEAELAPEVRAFIAKRAYELLYGKSSNKMLFR